MRRYKLSAVLLCMILLTALFSEPAAASQAQTEAAQAEAAQEAGNQGAGPAEGQAVCRITLPRGQEGFAVLPAGSTEVPPGGAFTFYVTIGKGYRKGPDFAVRAGDVLLKPVPPEKEKGKDGAAEAAAGTEGQAPQQQEKTDGPAAEAGTTRTPGMEEGAEKYVISGISGDLTVTVTGVESLTAPAVPDGGQETAQDQPAEEAALEPAQDQPAEEIPAEPVQDQPAEEAPMEPAQDQPLEEVPAEPVQDQPAEEVPAEPVQDQPMTADGQEAYAGELVQAPAEPAQDVPADPAQGQQAYDPGQELPAEAYAGQEYPGPEYMDQFPAEEVIDGIPAAYEGAAAEEGSETGSQQGLSQGQQENNQEASQAAQESGENAAAAQEGSGSVSVSEPAAGEQSSEAGQKAGTETGASDSGAQAAAGDQAENGYPIWVGGVQATAKNQADILGDKTLSFDPARHILTLKKAAIKKTGSQPAAIYYTGSMALTVRFTGSSGISADGQACGILSEAASVTLEGPGTLTLSSKAAADSACVHVKKGDLTIAGGTVTAKNQGAGAGFRAANIIIKNEIDKVEASSSKTAFYAATKLSIQDELGITTPAKGRISDNQKTIVNANKKTAAAAVIEPLPVYRVTFSANGGSGSMEAESVVSGKKLKLPACGFESPRCKKFSAWRIDGKNYKEGASITVTAPLKAEAQWVDAHTLQKIPRKAPACETDGNIEYYKCSICEKYFSDSEAKKQIQAKDTVLKAIGHKWGAPVYQWTSDYSKARARRVCQNDSSHVHQEIVSSNRTGTGPTCEKEGHYTYTAIFSDTVFKDQTKKVTLKALGHIWEKYEFIWDQNKDGSYEASIRFTCKRDSSHKKTEDAEVKTSVTIPGKNTDGKISCTAVATFNNKSFKDIKETAISPAGTSHYKYTEAKDSWTRDSGKEMKFTIKRDSYDLLTYNAFNAVAVDGKAVNKSYYGTEKGSLKLTLSPEFLNSLAPGNHTLLVDFKDGSAQRDFTVREASASSGEVSRTSPPTGDDSSAALWLLTAAGCAAAVLVLILVFRRRDLH